MQLLASPNSPSDESQRDKAIILLMSGGIDSSVSAWLLGEQGWDVIGVTMKIPVYRGGRLSSDAYQCNAPAVCDLLRIPHYFLEIEREFEQKVIAPFKEMYMQGRTPNPCAHCNAVMKFGVVWEFLRKTLGISNLATGHYALLKPSHGKAFLARAADKGKDQSYFLYGIRPEKLPDIEFPLGSLKKDQVRSLVSELQLPVGVEEESMELCFLGQSNYRELLAPEAGRSPGPVYRIGKGEVAQHKGICNYTIGQRRGLGFSLGEPVYVTHIDPGNNSITVGTYEEACSRLVQAHRLVVHLPDVCVRGGRLYGKIRSKGEPQACDVVDTDEESVTVKFDAPQFAPTAGQRLVIYDTEERVVAGGIIR